MACGDGEEEAWLASADGTAGRRISPLRPASLHYERCCQRKKRRTSLQPQRDQYHHRSAENGKKPPGAGKIGSGGKSDENDAIRKKRALDSL